MEIQSANNYKKPPMKNFLFYLGHILLIAFIISFMRGQTGLNYILLPVAVITYIIAFARQGRQFRNEGEEIISKYNRAAIVGHAIEGEMESPYILIFKNTSHKPQSIILDPHKNLEDMQDSEISLESAFSNVTVESLFKQMQNKPRNICMIEIFCSPAQMGMPVSYTNKTPEGSETIVFDEIACHPIRSTIYCDLNLKKGNNLNFMMLPATEMVVKLYPYRTIEMDKTINPRKYTVGTK